MEVSIFFAKAWGLYIIIIAVVVLLNKNSFGRWMKLTNDEGVLFFSGFLSLMIGILSVVAHNIWSFDWVGLVTLFGWMALLKGIILLGWPKKILKIRNTFKDNTSLMRLSIVLILIIGVYLTYAGYSY